MRRSRSHPTSCLLVLALPLLVALLSTAPLAAEELTLTYDVILLEEHEDMVHARVSLTAVNTSAEDLTNVNARAAGGTFLAEGVLQYTTIPAGKARSVDATFVVRAEQWPADMGIALRVEFEDATGAQHERDLFARSEEQGS